MLLQRNSELLFIYGQKNGQKNGLNYVLVSGILDPRAWLALQGVSELKVNIQFSLKTLPRN